MELAEAAAMVDVEALTATQVVCTEALAEGRDVLAVVPTGGGKSAIYQIAGAAVPGATVVVVPLLALSEDQHRSIRWSDLPDAARLDGSTSARERRRILVDAVAGDIEYLICTPEILQADEIADGLGGGAVSLFVVDEAHCIVTWGNGFRPDYLLLGEVRARLGDPTCVALTASADRRIRADIERMLRMDDPVVEVLPLIRPNIALHVEVASDADSARQRCVDHLAACDARTIAYVPTRTLCDELSEELRERGVDAGAYHGQMHRRDRTAAVSAFRDGSTRVMVATNAFGMGIDIADIDQVVHLDMPPTLLDYYQEIGRAARDGRPAEARAFVTVDSRSRRAFTSGVRSSSLEDCRQVVAAIAEGCRSRRAIHATTGLSVARVSRAATILTMAGVVDAAGPLALADVTVDLEVVERVRREREEFDRSQQQAVDAYPGATTCRWQLVLAALGESEAPCGTCDNCRAQLAVGYERLHPHEGRRICHTSFGAGTVVAVDGDEATVSFDTAGPKTIDLALCLDADLVEFDVD